MERNTRQRQAVQQALEEAGRPMSPQEVLAAAQQALPALGLATVYRQIKALTAEGWLVPVELPGEPARYERSGKAHHHHFRCRRCERIFEVAGCLLKMPTSLPKGFRLEDHEVVLFGVCADCAQSTPPRRPAAGKHTHNH